MRICWSGAVDPVQPLPHTGRLLRPWRGRDTDMPRNATRQRALENEESPSNQAAIPICRMPSMLSRTRLIWKVRKTLQTWVRRHGRLNLFRGNFQIDTWLSTTDLYHSLVENCQLPPK